MLYRTRSRENSSAFGTSKDSKIPQAQQAPLAFETVQALPGLILHLMNNDENRDFRTSDGQTSNVSNYVCFDFGC